MNTPSEAAVKINKNIIPDLTVGILIGILGTILLFFSRMSIGPVGLPVIFFVIIAILVFFITIISRDFYINRVVARICATYFLFLFSYTVAFLLSGSVTFSDIYFLISLATNIFWIIFIVGLAKYNKNLFISIFYSFSVLFSILILLVWVYGVAINGDMFYLRTKGFESGVLTQTIFKNPNELARSASIILPLILFIYFQHKNSILRKYGLIFIMISLIFVIISTLSRANFLTIFIFLVGSIALLTSDREISYKFKWKRVLVVVTLLVIVVVSFSPVLHNRINTLGNMFVKTWNIAIGADTRKLPKRTRTWYATYQIIRDNPLYGVGYSRIDQYQKKYGGYVTRNGEDHAIAVHSGFLKIAAYSGLVTLSIFILFYYRLYKFSKVQLTLNTTKSRERYAAYSLGLLLIMLVPMNIAADTFGKPLMWLSIAALIALATQKR